MLFLKIVHKSIVPSDLTDPFVPPPSIQLIDIIISCVRYFLILLCGGGQLGNSSDLFWVQIQSLFLLNRFTINSRYHYHSALSLIYSSLAPSTQYLYFRDLIKVSYRFFLILDLLVCFGIFKFNKAVFVCLHCCTALLYHLVFTTLVHNSVFDFLFG